MDETVRSELARLHDEEERQNHRISDLEDGIKTLQDIAMSVQKLAINMEHMLAELKSQGDRLSKIESEPAERWNTAKKTAFTSIVSVLAGALATAMLLAMAQYVK